MGILGAIGDVWGDAVDWTGRKLFGDNRARDKALEEKNFQLEGGGMLRDYAQGQLMGAQGRTLQASQLAGGPQDQWRAQQMALAQQMAGVAGGQQMGAGELAVRRQANQQAAQLAGQTQMARGANAGIAARAAARGLGDLGVNAAGAAAQQALTDQANARGQLAGLLGQGRGADLDMASQNAQLSQQAAIQNRAMNDQYALGMYGAYQGTSDAELRARMARAAMFQEDKGMFGDLLQAGGSILAARAGRPAG